MYRFESGTAGALCVAGKRIHGELSLTAQKRTFNLKLYISIFGNRVAATPSPTLFVR
jgi:hypothetical protein